MKMPAQSMIESTSTLSQSPRAPEDFWQHLGRLMSGRLLGHCHAIACRAGSGSAAHASGPRHACVRESIAIRVAEPADAARICAIYAPHVAGPAVSFESEPPSPVDMEKRVRTTLETHPWLVAVRGDEILGYAHARPYRERTAWGWCCETSIYVAPGFQGNGIATRLYDRLFDILAMQGYAHAFAVIMLPNAASVRMHERYGFSHRAFLPATAHKRGRWYDVGWWQLTFGELRENSSEPLPFCNLDAVSRCKN
jgi:phosphinothricin acetyltransferase